MSHRCPVPVLGICAFSGTGKTTLLRWVIPRLKTQGLRVAVLKHAHHCFDIDHPGKDSFELRRSGAEQVLIASSRRVALIKELSGVLREPRLADLLPFLDTRDLDLILVEGFKHDPIPKIELCRPALGHPLIHATDPHVIAVASDAPLLPPRQLPVLNLNHPEEILQFLLDWLATQSKLAATG
jgi:molybdopterin-guanine dinucleotide biosynthesis adapter protein